MPKVGGRSKWRSSYYTAHICSSSYYEKPDRNIIEDLRDEHTKGANASQVRCAFDFHFFLSKTTTDFHFLSFFLTLVSPPSQLVSHSSNEFRRPSTMNQENKKLGYRKTFPTRTKKKFKGGTSPKHFTTRFRFT